MAGEESRSPGDLRDSSYGILPEADDQTRRNLEILLRTIVEMSSAPQPQALLDSIVDRALAVADAERGFLLLRDRRGDLQVRVARNRDGAEIAADLPRSQSIPMRVARTGKIISMPYPSDIEGFSPTESVTDAKLLNIQCGPLRVRGRTIGVLYVDSCCAARRFTSSDRGLFKALCYELAFALELADLAHKEHALALARSIQERLIPSGALSLPGLDIHGVARPCDETGGDYFDYVKVRDGHLGLILGDVTGHGIGAALLMATCRSILRTIVSMEPHPARALTLANRSLCSDLDPEEFVSLFMAEVDREAGELWYARAGHASPLHFHGDTGEFSDLEQRGPLLGVMDDHEYQLAGPVKVRSGDVLVLYTDGIEEARREDDFFGRERIQEVVLELRAQPARRIAEQLIERVLAFSGGAAIDDDLTVVVVRFIDLEV